MGIEVVELEGGSPSSRAIYKLFIIVTDIDMYFI